THRQLRLPDITGHLAIPEPARALFRRARRSRRRPTRKPAVKPLDLAHGIVRVDGADDREHRVPRVIEIAVERKQRIARQGTQSWLAANAPTPNAVFVVQQLV